MGLCSAHITPELLDIPTSDDAAEAVTNDMDAHAGRKAIDQACELLRNGTDANARGMGKACKLHASAGERFLHRTEYARAGEDAVNEDDDFVPTGHLGKRRRDVPRHQDALSQGRDCFGGNLARAEVLAQGKRGARVVRLPSGLSGLSCLSCLQLTVFEGANHRANQAHSMRAGPVCD